jgi:hypothetical protein
MRSVFLIVIISTCSFKGFAQLFSFTFSGVGSCPTQGSVLPLQPPNLAVGALTRFGTLTCNSAADHYSTAGFSTNTGIDTTQYVELVITAHAGYSIQVNSVSFATSRNAKGPANGRVAHDEGTGVFSDFHDYSIGTTSGSITWDMPDFTGTAAGTLRFRIYGWAATAAAGTLRLDDLVLQGSVISTGPLHIDYINNRVAIGNTSPTANLHASGTVRFEDLNPDDTSGRVLVTDTSGRVGYKKLSAIASGWNVTGNAGLGTANFIGTTDRVDLVFKRFNIKSGQLGSTNTSFGFSGLSSANTGLYNTAVGGNSLKYNTTGISNTALGYQSLYANTTGTYNTAIGDSVLVSSTIGYSNVGLGAYSLYKLGSTGITTGISNHVALGTSAMGNFLGNARSAPNTAVGGSAMAFTTTGDGNTAVGGASMYANTTGQDNTALGYWSLRFNTTGRENLAIGTTSLRQNTVGNQNVGIGREALRNDSSGIGNVGIGYQVGYNNFNGSKNVFIGYQAGYPETGSNKLYIANSSTSVPLIYGDFSTGRVGIGTNKISDTAYKLFVESGIRTRKIKVDAFTWADFVFDKSYRLLPLSELDRFIQQHKHLPGVPSAPEVATTGIDVAQSQAMLLEKIEELTLYVIAINNKVKVLEKKMVELKKSRDTLKKRK